MSFLPSRLLSIAAAIGGCFLLQVIGGQLSSYMQSLLILAGVYVTLSVSLNLINGITGQFSIGHAAFYMIGAYTAGALARALFEKAGMPGWAWLIVAMLAGGLLAAIAGFIVGLPSLRLKGDYLAIVTMGFGEIVNIVVRNQESLGKAYGFAITPKLPSIMLTWLLAVVCIAVCRNLLKNVHGLTFLAVREDEVASSAMGVNVTRVKVTAFVLGSAFAGAAGAMYAHALGFVSPTNFSMDVSFIILTMVVLGGSGSITGSAVAAVVLFYIPERLRDLKTIPMSGFVMAIFATIITVAVIKRIMDMHMEKGKQTMAILTTVVGGIILTVVGSFAFKKAPGLDGTIDGNKLRFVIFAAVLVVLMLLRPQGVFAHHEFSWKWLRKLLKKDTAPAVSA